MTVVTRMGADRFNGYSDWFKEETIKSIALTLGATKIFTFNSRNHLLIQYENHPMPSMKLLQSKKAVIQKAFLKNYERQIQTLLHEAKGYNGSKQIHQEPGSKIWGEIL